MASYKFTILLYYNLAIHICAIISCEIAQFCKMVEDMHGHILVTHLLLGVKSLILEAMCYPEHIIFPVNLFHSISITAKPG